MSWDIEAFKKKIETGHHFPGTYVFKFIVPKDKEQEVIAVLQPQSEISLRSSSNKKYVSVTSQALVHSSDEVLDVYLAANKIEGCIAL